MELKLYQVDAFADNVFEGNPAAVCPLEEWLPDKQMQSIALENNLSETAFFVKNGDRYRLRWFTPKTEVDLCGHATLASAHTLFEHLGHDRDEIIFDSNSGELRVKKEGGKLKMNFPATSAEKTKAPEGLLEALGVDSAEVYRATDLMVVLDSQSELESLAPNFFLLGKVNTRGIIATAPAGDGNYDFVSRFFAPAVGIDEDPVTGSAHTMLAPYWAERLGKNALRARQVSDRGGNVFCEVKGDRVELSGKAVTYMTAQIVIG